MSVYSWNIFKFKRILSANAGVLWFIFILTELAKVFSMKITNKNVKPVVNAKTGKKWYFGDYKIHDVFIVIVDSYQWLHTSMRTSTFTLHTCPSDMELETERRLF